ncbi:MAG: hypothetical protein ACLQBB_07780 [Solirubrobacteraceae bacterium]
MAGLLGAVESLSTHRLLDRLIRGRMWIGIVAFALIGIVTLQLGLLKLNSGIGRALEREAALQRDNAALSIENSELAGGDRVESEASRLGMQLVSIANLRFLSSQPATDISRAAAALSAPTKAAGEAGAASASSVPAAGSAEETSSPTARSGEAAGQGEPAPDTGGQGATAPREPATATAGGESGAAGAAHSEAAAGPPHAEPSSPAEGGGTAAPGG